MFDIESNPGPIQDIDNPFPISSVPSSPLSIIEEDIEDLDIRFPLPVLIPRIVDVTPYHPDQEVLNSRIDAFHYNNDNATFDYSVNIIDDVLSHHALLLNPNLFVYNYSSLFYYTLYIYRNRPMVPCLTAYIDINTHSRVVTITYMSPTHIQLIMSFYDHNFYIHFDGHIAQNLNSFFLSIIFPAHIDEDDVDVQSLLFNGGEFDLPAIQTLITDDDPDLVALLLQHDIELNPGPSALSRMLNRELSVLKEMFKRETLHDYIQFENHYNFISVMYDLSNMDLDAFCVYDKIYCLYVSYKLKIHNLYDSKDLDLMFDIESNPGPTSNELRLVALYLDCMNYAATPRTAAFVERFHRMLAHEYIELSLINFTNDHHIELLRHIREFLFPTPQMFSSLNPLSAITPSIDNLSDAIRNAKVDLNISPEIMADLTGIATKVSEINIGIDPTTREFLTPKVPDVLNLTNVFLWIQSPKNATCTLAIVISILFLCRRKYPTNSSLIALCGAFGVIAMVYFNSTQIISFVSKWVFPEPTPQGGDDDWATIVCETLSIGFFSKSISISDPTSFAKDLIAAEKYSRGFSDFISRIKDLITRIIGKLADSFGIELNLGFDKHARAIKTFSNRLVCLKQDPAMFDGNITFQFSRSVKSLEDDVNCYLAKITASKENTSYSIALLNIMRLMSPLLSVVRNSHMRRIVRRVPFNVNFVGPSGVGKTQLTNAMVPMVFAKQASAEELQRATDDFFSICYAPGLNDRFYDTYNNQFAWMLNDFLQRKEAEGAQQSDVLLFIQMLGGSPLPLNCAEITKKGLVMFASDFVITSMNCYCITEHVCKVLTHLKALIRRVNEHFNVLVTIKPEYRSAPRPEPGVVYPYEDPKFYSSLDKDKAMAIDHPNGINTDVYVFDEWDSGTGQYKHGGFRNFTYEQAMNILYARLDIHIEHQDRINSQTAQFMNRVLGDRIAELHLEARMPINGHANNIVVNNPLLMPRVVNNPLHFPQGNEEEYFVDNPMMCWTHSLTDDVPLNSFISDLDVDVVGITDDLLRELSLDISTYEEAHSMLLDSPVDESLSQWITRYISTCVKDGCRYVIGFEYGFFKSADNIYNKILESANWVDLFYLADYNFSDSIVYHSLRLRNSFSTVISAAETISHSFLKRMVFEFNNFYHNPLLWFRDHPYLSMVGIVAGSVGSIALYKGLNMLLDWSFKIFGFAPKSESHEEVLVDVGVEPQGGEKIDKTSEFMRKPLYNFYQVIVRVPLPCIGKNVISQPSQCFAISDFTVELPYHVINFIEMYKKREGYVKTEIGLIPVGSRLTVPPEWFNVEHLIIDVSMRDRDIARITFPSSGAKFPCIKKFIPKYTPELMALLKSREVSCSIYVVRSGILARERAKLKYIGDFSYPFTNMMKDTLTNKFITQEPFSVKLNNMFSINYPTQIGDCYMATFIDDPILQTLTRFDKSLQNPILAYRHLAGHDSIGIGFGQMMFREDYAAVPSSGVLCPQEQLEVDSEMRKSMFEKIIGVQHNSTEMFSALIEQPKHFAPHHIAVATCLPMTLSRNNSITKSELHYEIRARYGPLKMPVTLFVTPEGDPMEIARRDYGSNLEFSFNYPAAFQVAGEVVSEIFDNSGPILHTRVYTTKEVLEGVPAEGIRSNDRSTSWGYSMKALAKLYGFSFDDLRWAFGRGADYEYTTPFAKLVIELCAYYDISLQEGTDFAHAYLDCLKAECKDTNKARLFCACDKIFLLKCKQYFGGFANWIYVNRIRNGIAIGINPYAEWDIFYKWLTEFAMYGMWGDYGKYDKRQISFLMFVTKMCYKAYYIGCPERENLARDVLFEKFVKTLHIALDKGIAYVYEWFHGNTSGNLLTAIINSITGLFIVKYCCCDILTDGGIDHSTSKTLNSMFKILRRKVRTIVYGDDNGIMIHPDLQSKITFYTMKSAIERLFNLEYTDEMKGKRLDYVVPDHTHIDQANFIARSFAKVGTLTVGPLRECSMFQSLAWYKSNVDPLDKILDVERVLKECSPRGPDYFYLHQPFLSEICLKKLKKLPRFMVWDEAFAAFQAEESLYFDPSFIYGDLNREGLLMIPDYETSDIKPPDKGIDAFPYPQHCISEQYNNMQCDLVTKSQGDLYALCLNKSIRPQSNDGEKLVDGGAKTNDKILNTVSCDTKSTTCFVEDESIVKSNLKTTKISNGYEVKLESIKDFLAKPYLLNVFQWTSTSVENTNLYYFDIGPLLTSVVPWEVKRRGFELIRGTFNVRVQVNASPFQAGHLLIHYLPNYADRLVVDFNYPTRYNSYLIQKYQHPHIELDARDAVAIMSIPYISPTPYFDVKEGKYDWGRVFIDVVSPFASGSTGILNAEVSVFGYWTDIEMAAAIVPQSNPVERFQARSGKSVEALEFKSGPIENGLLAVSQAASSLSEIPFLTAVMAPVAWASGMASRVASIFGWSKPRANEHMTMVNRQPLRYIGTGDGSDVSIPTTLTCLNAVKLTDEYSVTSQDEMSLKYLLSVPTYKGRINWTTGTLSGANLLSSFAISPQVLMSQVDYVSVATTHRIRYGAPLYYLSNFFSLYRGSIKVHVKIVKTIFHSGKLLVTFTPIVTTAVAPTNTTSIYSLREIIDIRESSDFTLSLPYMLSRPYLSQDQSIGSLQISVLNDLRCPETVAQSVDLLVWYTAGDDFEFQVPQMTRTSGPSTFTPQSSSEEVLVDDGIGNTRKEYCSTANSEMCIGEHFLSVKQFLNRSALMQFNTSQTYASSGIAVYPWHVGGFTNNPGTGLLRTPGYLSDAFSFIAPMYNYFRGKARVLVNSDVIGNMMVSDIPYLFKDLGLTPPFTTTATTFGVNQTYTSASALTTASFQTPVPSGINHGHGYQHVPYYNKFPVSFVNTFQGDTTNFFTADETVPLSCALTTCNSSFGNTTTIQRSFCDDFQLLFFIGCPAIYVSSF